MTFYIGNQTAFFTTDPEEPFKYAQKQHFTAFEWFADKKFYDGGWSTGWFYDDLSDERAAELSRITQKTGIRFSVHASCVATPLTHEGMKDIFRAVEVADTIGAKLVNIHYDESSGVEDFVHSLEPVIIATQVRDIQLAIENTPMHSPEEFNHVFQELYKKYSGSIKHVGMCIDIGHANCCEATRNDYIGFIDRLNLDVKIIHAHIHENWGDSDSHLPLFTASSAKNDSGIRMFIDRLKERSFSGSLIMEQWPDEHEILDNIFIRLSNIIGIDDVLTENVPAEHDSSIVADGDLLERNQKEIDNKPEEAASEIDREFVANILSKTEIASGWALEEIVEFSRVRKSWRKRLEAIKDLFFDSRKLENSDLAAIAVYLRFLSTAEIPCIEDGGHYRPCHHAKAALEIEEAMTKISNKSNTWILRKIFPYLPSHSEEFMRHEPLTRIRDIAHRNDIPKELKLDIKHNLQNKLHRSAGPEDLKTAERILKLVTDNNAEYSSSFVGELKLFYSELQEFFNAPGLEKRLYKIKDSFVELSGVIDSFIEAKSKGNPIQRATSAWEVRKEFADFSSHGGLYAFSPLRLADIELEDYAFATISESINELDKSDRASVKGLEIIIIALEHIVLSGFMEEESKSILSEIKSWKELVFDNPSRLDLLRLWASVQRGLRLCTNFADIVTDTFTSAVITLGKAFKVPQHAIEVYCEGDIRANLIFQLSRMLGRAQRALRTKLEFAPWSVINGGFAKGILVKADTLEAFEEKEGNFIVVLSHAEGDEEIPSSVKGILLAHPIAHLSHLGVRARSGAVPFAAAEEKDFVDEFNNNINNEVCLEFNQYGVSKTQKTFEQTNISEAKISIPDIDVNQRVEAFKADSIRSEMCGGKAGASAELFNLSEKFTEFVAPKVMGIPYGVMECCLAENNIAQSQYDEIISSIDSTDLDKLEEPLMALSEIILSQKIPDDLLNNVRDYFGEYTLLAVRSSSSGEDLEGFAGAGLYDSVIGVKGSELELAIKQVWASKWTKRAFLSRKQYGLPHSKLYMGVLIQEVVNAEYSFVIHTVNPVTGEHGEMSIELAVGFGETLASANQAGSPCSISYSRKNDSVDIVRCADISNALVLSDVDFKLIYSIIDYSKFDYFLGDNLYKIANDLGKIGSELEKHFGTAQDIEGAFAGGKYYIVQSRAQSGVENE